LKDNSITIIAEADQLLMASQNLDYSKIASHDVDEVAKLKATLFALKIGVSNNESLDGYATKQSQVSSSGMDGETKSAFVDDEEGRERQARILDSLGQEGFDDRAGQVYNSFVKSRRMRFQEVPHRLGLPEFDVVISPDFAPNPGLHGIFINSKAVMSITLALDDSAEGKEWKVLKRKEYEGEEQMVDCATLMSAGFDVPD